MDVINNLLVIEREIREFHKAASSMIYDGYLKLEDLAESSKMCDVADSYNWSQTVRISATIISYSLLKIFQRAYWPRTFCHNCL